MWLTGVINYVFAVTDICMYADLLHCESVATVIVDLHCESAYPRHLYSRTYPHTHRNGNYHCDRHFGADLVSAVAI